jgi:protease I
MKESLTGKRIAFLATDGVEQSELTEPWKALRNAGADLDLVSLETGEIKAMRHLAPGDRFAVDTLASDADVADYDGLVLPGGVVNPDALRLDRSAVAFVRAFFERSKPVAAICHGPWMLVEADVLRDRTITSWPSLQTDIRNAGGRWVDQEVHVDGDLVTSRKPDDLPAFCAKTLEVFADHRLAPHESSRYRGEASRRHV